MVIVRVLKLIHCERATARFSLRMDWPISKIIRLKAQQIVADLREIEVKIGQSRNVLTACSEAGATDKSYYRWRREYGGMKVDQAKRLKQLEQETARLKRLVGEMHLEKVALPDVAR